MKRKNYKYSSVIPALALSVLLLGGCGNERLENELSYRTIGINCMEEGDYAGAIQAFDTALEQHIGKIGETELDISYYRAAAQYASGDMQGALDSYQNLLDYNKEDKNAYYMKGCILLGQGETKDALACFDNALKYGSADYELYVGIYENLAGHQMEEDGKAYLNKAFEIKGNSADNHAWRGRIYTMLGEYDNAVTELKAALEKESVIANLYLAQALHDAQGDRDNAQKYYQAYLETGAEDSVAMNAMAGLAIAQGDYAGALSYVNKGLEMEQVPNKRALMQNRIIACEYTGDFASAYATAQEYVALYPDDVSVQREYTFLKNRQGVQEEKVEAEIEMDSPRPTEPETEN